MTATLALEPSDPTGLADYAAEVSTPGSPMYRGYLTESEFTSRFGASPAAISSVVSSMKSDGLSATVSANHLSVRLAGREAAFAKAFRTTFHQYRLAGGRVAFANLAPPVLPSSIGADVQAVIGLDDLYPEIAQPVRSVRRTSAHTATTLLPQGGGGNAVTPCTSSNPNVSTPATAIEDNGGGYTDNQVADAYQLNGLYSAGDEGAGQTIGMYELEPYLLSDIQGFQSCYGISTDPELVSYVKVDPNAPSDDSPGSGESEMDIDNAVGLAPKASVIVYLAANSGNAPYDLWSNIISADKATVVSTSWLLPEDEENYQTVQAENTLFMEAAVQGQSIISASGDNGSQGGTPGYTGYAVMDPASQPYVTGVGGTSLTYTPPQTTRSESVWNNGSGASGGGISAFWTMPSYQRALGTISGESSYVPCESDSIDCREVPDVSLDADPLTGYTVYYTGNGFGPWQIEAGTSGAAPTFAALIALANASSQCANVNIGFVNPTLYTDAASDYSSDFYDVTSGNNSAGGGYPLFPALSGYDMASGLGTPNGTHLAASLCGNIPPHFYTASPPSYSYGDTLYSYRFVAKGRPDDPTYQLGAGAPSWLSINRSTGEVSGTPPLGIASFSYSVIASNGQAPNATAGPFTVPVYPPRDGKGYWLVASDGGIFAYGDAHFYGSTGGITLNKPVVGMAATPDGKGYWLVASDGGIFAYGDAHFYGSTGGITLNKPVVGMAPTPDAGGYWLVASDGGIFNYGDAGAYGGLSGIALNRPVVGLTSTPDGKGYWLVASDGGVFAEGDAVGHGSTGGITLNKPVVGMSTG
jgi:subtilase family serine protease